MPRRLLWVESGHPDATVLTRKSSFLPVEHVPLGRYKGHLNIFVDESGNFSLSARPDSWCAVAAYVSPERDRRHIADLVSALRRECGAGQEVKLPQIQEPRYLRFLEDLRA